MKPPSIRIGLKSFLLIICFAACLAATHAAPPSVQPLLKSRWPGWPRGSAYDVKAVGNYAYIALGEAGLAVVDVSNPANPVQVGGCDFKGKATHVAVSGHYAYVVAEAADEGGGEGLHIIDVSNPTNCVRSGVCFLQQIEGVAVSGNYAYVALFSEGLRVIDVSNPAHCVRVGGWGSDGPAYGVAVAGNYAYMLGGDEDFSFAVIDVSNPTNCVRVGGNDDFSCQSVAVSGHYAYVIGCEFGSFLQVFDVSNPTNCTHLGEYYLGDCFYGGGHYYPKRDLTVVGNHAYVTDAANGLQVIDVSNPTNCVRVGGYDTSGNASGVAVVADRIYVADGSAGLLVLPSIPNIQFTLRIDATPSLSFTLETATNLLDANSWQPLLTTNVATMPFDFVDFDVKLADKPQKFYRVRQP